ncbi:MAG: IPT/TIG domain-containing protein [Pyrinomonadaceae bacterium]
MNTLPSPQMNTLPSRRVTSCKSTHAKLFTALALILLLTAPFLLADSSARRSKAEADVTTFAAPAQRESGPTADVEPPQRHVLAASYYSLKDKLNATLMFNNKSPSPMDARVTLFSLGGERLEVPRVTVEGVSHRTVDLRDYAAAGSTFEEGSLQVVYYGKPLQMGAQVRVVDAEHSLISDEQLTYPVQASSTRRVGAWQLPSRTCDVRLVISNVSNEQITVNTNADGQPALAEGLLTLMSHETRVLNLRERTSAKGRSLPEVGGLSLEHSGPKGALMARVLIQEATTGYSLVADLVDPEKSRSSRLQGAGLRLGNVAGEELTPAAVARNVGHSSTTVTGRIRYTRRDGGTRVVYLPKVQLAPGQTKAVNLANPLRGARLEELGAAAGLEFEYTGDPGSVVMSAQSTGRSGNQVFRVPLLDPAAQRSSTGGYPWMVEGDQSTVVYLKNTTDQPQRYVAHLKSAGGIYMIGQKVIEPGVTMEYDIRALRDLQVPDENGNTIPLEATHGHFKWSVILEEDATEDLVMIGRAEHYNVAQAMSSTYACASCCSDSTVGSYVTPFFTVEVFADDIVDFDAVEIKQDCYGDEYHSIRTFGVSWNSGDSEVTSVNSSGTVTALNGGESDIQAVFAGRYYYTQECYPQYGPETGYASDEIQPNLPACGGCRFNFEQQRPKGRMRVKPKITSITPDRGVAGAQTGVTIAGRGFGSNPSVTIGGSGVTYSGSGGSATQLSGNLSVAGNATAGNHTVQVSHKGQSSNSVNFFVQVPTSLRRDRLDDLVDIDPGPGDIMDGFGQLIASNRCGAYRNVVYTLVDQAGQPIIADLPITEALSNYQGPPELQPGAKPPRLTRDGVIGDTQALSGQSPTCPPPFSLSFTQRFSVTVGQTTFSLTTVNACALSKDGSGNYSITISITTQ